MQRIVFICFLFFVFSAHLSAQYFIIKGGATIGTQKWDNSFDGQPLVRYNGAFAIETQSEEEEYAAFFTEIGYHVKGSSTRSRFLFQGGGIQNFQQHFIFNNLSLLLGAKQKKVLDANKKYYYLYGLRGDYTLSTNIDELTQANQYVYINNPLMGGVQRWMFGLTVGGGLEINFRELIGAQIELTLNPDITPQYRQGPINNVIVPSLGTVNIPERRIRNTTVELTVGLRLLRKVIYED
jgi:hypothetical protein